MEERISEVITKSKRKETWIICGLWFICAKKISFFFNQKKISLQLKSSQLRNTFSVWWGSESSQRSISRCDGPKKKKKKKWCESFRGLDLKRVHEIMGKSEPVLVLIWQLKMFKCCSVFHRIFLIIKWHHFKLRSELPHNGKAKNLWPL